MAGDDIVCCSKSKAYQGCEYVRRSVLGWDIQVQKAFGYSRSTYWHGSHGPSQSTACSNWFWTPSLQVAPTQNNTSEFP